MRPVPAFCRIGPDVELSAEKEFPPMKPQAFVHALLDRAEALTHFACLWYVVRHEEGEDNRAQP